MALEARDARAEDYADFARMFLELKVPDRTPGAEEYGRKIAPHTFFLWEGDAPVAYSYWQAMGKLARVFHVVVDSRAQGRGLGGALMREIAARARAAGCIRWMLAVKPDNTPALRLYASVGMKERTRWASMAIDWKDVARLPASEGTESFLVAPEEEAAIEAAMGQPPGMIAVQRADGGRVFIGLRRAGASAGEAIGFASFDPDFPGAFPFAAKSVEIVRGLLEGMRPHARAEHTSVRINVGGELAPEMAKVGARMVLETVRMEGEIER